MRPRTRSIIVLGIVSALLPACARDDASAVAGSGPLLVYNAGSLARPLRAALDSFAARTGANVLQESSGSLEAARKLMELHKTPDVIALADYEVFPQLLMPSHVTWYASFARNRLVLAHTPRSRFAGEIDAANWSQIMVRPGVEVGRADPNLDPTGYRTLIAFDLAERHEGRAGLADELRRAASGRNVRSKGADLVALLQAGEIDYAWVYESVAQAASLGYVRLPDRVDLGTPAESAFYAGTSVRVAGTSPRDSLTFRGEAIRYALSIPAAAQHPELAARFVTFLLSPDGARILRRERLDVLDDPVFAGSGVPAALDSLAHAR
jgi:molybdate/tungstate transport system substrate-binding protein